MQTGKFMGFHIIPPTYLFCSDALLSWRQRRGFSNDPKIKRRASFWVLDLCGEIDRIEPATAWFVALQAMHKKHWLTKKPLIYPVFPCFLSPSRF